MADLCPKGHSVPEECFAPFLYCPEKGCGRAEGGIRLPTEAEPEPVEVSRDDQVRNLLATFQQAGKQHYNPVRECDEGHQLNVGVLEILGEAQTAQRLLDLAGVPDGDQQGRGDLDWRVTELVIDLIDLRERLGRITDVHTRETGPAGMVGDYCNECQTRWPCETYKHAKALPSGDGPGTDTP